MADIKAREAVAIFHDEATLQAAVDELLISGFDRSDLGLLADRAVVEAKLGHRIEHIADLEDDSAVPVTAFAGVDSRAEAKGAIIGGLAYVGAIASIGALAASGGLAAVPILVGALVGGGAGGLVGVTLARLIDQRHAQRIQRQIEKGGLLLWVHTPDPDHERDALDILARHGAEDAHVHDVPAIRFSLNGGVSKDMSFMKKLGL